MFTPEELDIIESLAIRQMGEAMSERNDMTRLSGAYPGRDGVQTRLDRAQRLVVEADVILRKIDSIRKGQQNVL